MALVVPRLHEPRQRQLLQCTHRAGVETEPVAEPFGQRLGQHHVANAESTPERLRERVRVNDPPSPIEGREWRYGTPRHAELAVEVIFDEVARPGTGSFHAPTANLPSRCTVLGRGNPTLGPFQQRAPARHRHRDTGGKLVRRRAVQHVDAGTLERLQDRPFPIESDRPHRHVVRLVDARKPRIAGVFHAVHQVAAEQLHEQTIKRLGTGTDHDLVGMHLHAAKAPQMRRDGRPQPRRSLRPRRLQHRALALVGQHAPQRPCPRRVGKHPFRRRRPREIGEPFASGAILAAPRCPTSGIVLAVPRCPAFGPVIPDARVAPDFRRIPAEARFALEPPTRPRNIPFATSYTKGLVFCGKFFEGFDAATFRNPHFGYAERAFALETGFGRRFHGFTRRNPRKTCQIRADFLHIEAAAGHGTHIALGHQLV